MKLFLMFNLSARCLFYQLQTYLDMSLQPTESSQHSEIGHHSMGGERHYPSLNCDRDTADDQGCSIQDRETTSDEGIHERSMSPERHGRTGVCICEMMS